MRMIDRAGTVLLAIGLIGLGVVGLATGRLIERLQLLAATPALAWINGMVFVGVGAGLLLARTRPWAGWALTALTVASLAGQAAGLARSSGDITLWVAASQTLTLAAVGWALAAPADPRAGLSLRLLSGAMLILFGAVHLVYRDAISGLIPSGFPARDVWPLITGSVQVAAGLAVVTGWRGGLAAAAIGAMFLSWLPLVHLPRLISAPSSREEWTFALMALTLAGAVWIAARAEAPKGRRF